MVFGSLATSMRAQAARQEAQSGEWLTELIVSWGLAATAACTDCMYASTAAAGSVRLGVPVSSRPSVAPTCAGARQEGSWEVRCRAGERQLEKAHGGVAKADRCPANGRG
jgi:hypothetical protein